LRGIFDDRSQPVPQASAAHGSVPVAPWPLQRHAEDSWETLGLIIWKRILNESVMAGQPHGFNTALDVFRFMA
jgi:hypothetical protein